MRSLAVIKLCVALLVSILLLGGLFSATRPHLTSAQYKQPESTVYLINNDKESLLVENTSISGVHTLLGLSVQTIIDSVESIQVNAKDEITVSQGRVYMTGFGDITFNSHRIGLSKVKMLIENDVATLFEGDMVLDSQLFTAPIVVNMKSLDIVQYKRAVYKDIVYNPLKAYLKSQQILPQSISDFDAPTITIVSPQQESTVNQPTVNIVGTVNESRSVYINDEIITLDSNNQFAVTQSLNEGKNTLVIRAEDEWGNSNELTRVVVYEKARTVAQKTTPIQQQTQAATSQPPSTPAVPSTWHPESTASCESAAFVSEFLSILNNYRRENGKNNLSIDNSLSLAGCDHTKWMRDTGVFSHTGINGSSPVLRCQNRNTYCDAENLAYSYPDMRASHFFELFRNSPGHNANMLGDHTVVGIAIAGIYVSNVFR